MIEGEPFCAGLAEYFGLERSEVQLSSRFELDLGFDSIMFLELAMMFEEVAGHPLSEQAIASLDTVESAWLFVFEMSCNTSAAEDQVRR